MTDASARVPRARTGTLRVDSFWNGPHCVKISNPR